MNKQTGTPGTAEQLRELTREAHEATRDARAALRDLRAEHAKLSKAAADIVGTELTRQLVPLLEKAHETIKEVSEIVTGKMEAEGDEVHRHIAELLGCESAAAMIKHISDEVGDQMARAAALAAGEAVAARLDEALNEAIGDEAEAEKRPRVRIGGLRAVINVAP